MASDHCLVPSPVKTPYSILNLLEQFPTTHAVFFTPVLHKDHNVYVVLRGRWDFADTFNIRLRNREQIRVCLFHVSIRWDAPRPKYPPSKRFQKNWHRRKKMATSWRGLIDQVCRIAGYFSHTQCRYPKHTLFFAISLNQPFTIPAFPFLNFTYHQFHNTRRWHLCWRVSYPNWWEHLFQRQLCPRWASQNFDSSRTCKQFGLVSGYLQITLIEPLPSTTVQEKDPCFFRVQPRSWALDKWFCSLPII